MARTTTPLSSALTIAEDMDFGTELELFIHRPPPRKNEDLLALIEDRFGQSHLPSLNRYNARNVTPRHDEWCLENDDSLLTTGPDRIRIGNASFLGFEVISPILNGQAGLGALEKMLETVLSLRCYANVHCGYHVHAAPRERLYTQQEARNFVSAASRDESGYRALISPKRYHNKHCLKYLSTQLGDDARQNIQTLKPEKLVGSQKRCKITLFRLKKLIPYWQGAAARLVNPYKKTIEFRGKEAEGFETDNGMDLLAYTATVVNFTSAALKTGEATFREAARQAFGDTFSAPAAASSGRTLSLASGKAALFPAPRNRLAFPVRDV